MKIADARALSADELAAKRKALARERVNLRFRLASAQLEDTSSIRKTRRDYARLIGVAAERARAAASSSRESARAAAPKGKG